MPDLVLFVPDVSCTHCKETIETAVTAVPSVSGVEVRIDQRLVTVDFGGAPSVDAVVAAIEQSHSVANHTG